MEYLEIDGNLVETYPDLFALEVVGSCCEPDIHDGEHVLLTNLEPVSPGKFIVADDGRGNHLGRVNRVINGELVVGESEQGGIRYAWINDVRGVVVATV